MNRLARATAAAVFGVFLFSCSQLGLNEGKTREVQLTGNGQLPAARGNATVTTTDDGNTKIDLNVEHLARPDEINPEATVYVVWAQDKAGVQEPRNLGALMVDEDLEGNITAVTPLRAFDLFITAEPSPRMTTPSGEQLMTTNIDMH
jgi:hypothetical protein